MTQPKPYRYWLKIFDNRLEIWDSQVEEVYATFTRQFATILGAMDFMRELNREEKLKEQQRQDELEMEQKRIAKVIRDYPGDPDWPTPSLRQALVDAGFGEGGVL